MTLFPTRLCWALIFLVIFAGEAARSQAISAYEDIYFSRQARRLIFGNAKLRLEFDAINGNWLAFGAQALPESIIASASKAMDFRLDGAWIVERHGATLLRHEVSVEKMRKAVTLRLVYGVRVKGETQNSRGVFDYELTAAYALFPNEARLERTARLVRNKADAQAAGQASRMEGFAFELPGAVLAEPDGCVVDVPGPFFPKTFVAPGTPYLSLIERQIGFHSAPDAGFGLLAITNKRRRLSLGSWMETAGEVAYQSSLRGDGKRLTLSHNNLRAYFLPANFAIDSDVHHVELTGDALPGVLASYRRMVERTMPVAPTPDWVRDMVLLEAYPLYYKNGLKGLTEKLPFYKKIGFTAIYVMPHWTGGYSPIDLYRVEPSIGTVADLKELVRTAHALGLRVLFDMVIHGFNEKSPLTTNRPELFVRTETGALARHPTWKSVTTDWAAAAYQKYMVELVQHDVREYGIDGYRVDAATYKGPGWDPGVAYPAYRSGSAAPELMTAMLRAMRELRPDAVLLSEVFGPVYYSVCNLVHDNQTEAPQLLLEKMEIGEITAAHYKEHLAQVYDALPAGVNRVFYTRNHDTSWFYHFNGYTPRFMSMEAVHAFFGIPEIFGGDPKNEPHPDADPAIYQRYAKLFAARRKFPELVRGQILLREADADNARVFTGLRRAGDRLTLVAVSFSDREENVSVKVTASANQKNMLTVFDAISGKILRAEQARPAASVVQLRLKPFQVLICRL